MTRPESTGRIQFEPFELDLRTHELRRNGVPVKLQDQPAKLLALLASRAGELVTRAEIEKALWSDGEFVEFEHAVNTAIRKVREALGDNLEKPRFVETLPRKGYRFIARVRTDVPAPEQAAPDAEPAQDSPGGLRPHGVLSSPRSRALFLTIQIGYLVLYAATLYYSESAQQALARLIPGATPSAAAIILAGAMCGIAVRLYLISSVGLQHPAAGEKFRRLFPALFILDIFWALSPLLLAHRIGLGLAMGSIAALAYLPFSQRTLMRSIYFAAT